MLLNEGYAHATQRQVLKPRTVRLLCRDWLRLKSVSRKQKLHGWGMGRDVGWCPLGHWMPKDRLPTGLSRLSLRAFRMFMGGITTSWSMSFETKMLQVPLLIPFGSLEVT